MRAGGAKSGPTSRRGCRAGPRQQSGQVIILVVILALVLLLGGLLVYNVGRVNLVKTRLQNTADSASYSSAVLMARAYNFTAYTNRAMVANQVAIAQMVSLASWSRFYCLVFTDADCGKFTTDGTDEVILAGLALFEPGEPGETVNEAYQGISETAFSFLNGVTGPVVTMLNGLEQMLSVASEVYLTGTALEIPVAAQQVVKDNDPNASLSTAGWGAAAVAAGQLEAFVKQYTPLNNQDDATSVANSNRFHDVTTASLDAWTKSRGGPEIPPFTSGLTAAGDCFGDGVGGIMFTGGWGGSTSLTHDNTQWKAKDVGDYVGIGVCVIMVPTPIGPIPVPIPIVIPTPPSIGQGIAGGSAGQWQVGTFSGLRKYMGLKSLDKPDWESPTITLFVERPTSSIDTTAQMKAKGRPIAGGALETTDSQAAGEMQVASSANAYFVRPDGQWSLGGSLVYGNLFNPYWEAHLVETPLAAIAIVDGSQASGVP